MSAWYMNPAWYALIISVIALAMILFNYFFLRRAKRSEIMHGLIRQAVEINESIAHHGIKGPYGQALNIPDESMQTFNAKGSVFLNHINLLRGVYDHKDLLSKDTVDAYLRWVNTIVKPWVESDQDLRDIWRLFRESEDLVGKDFLQWLSPSLPLVGK